MFTQLCVWEATTLGESTSEDMINYLQTETGCRLQYAEQVTTLPGLGGEGGRTDQLFYVHSEDVGKFAIPRLTYGIRWWEDAYNQAKQIYPQEILNKYPKTW